MEIIGCIILGALGITILGGLISLFLAVLPYLLVGGAICLILVGIGVYCDMDKGSSSFEIPEASQSQPDESTGSDERQYQKRSRQQEEFHNEALTYVYKKSGVNLNSLQPALDSAIVSVTAAFQEVLGPDYSPTVTSGDDYMGHCNGSAHYSGAALDFRLKDIKDPYHRELVTEAVREYLGDRFLVDHEAAGGINEHLHVQLRKGTYSKVAWH